MSTMSTEFKISEIKRKYGTPPLHMFGLELNNINWPEIETRVNAAHLCNELFLKQPKENNMTTIKTSEDYIEGLKPTKSNVPVSTQVNMIERQLSAVRGEIKELTKNMEVDGRLGAYPVPVREKFVERYNKIVEAQLKDACKEYDALLDKLNRIEKLL